MSRTRLRAVTALLIVGGLLLASGGWFLASASDGGWNATTIVFAAVGLVAALAGLGMLVRGSRT